MLNRYRGAIREATPTRLGGLTPLVGAGYFFVWTVFGILAYALGLVVTSLVMQQLALARAVPVAAAVIILIAGAFHSLA